MDPLPPPETPRSKNNLVLILAIGGLSILAGLLGFMAGTRFSKTKPTVSDTVIASPAPSTSINGKVFESQFGYSVTIPSDWSFASINQDTKPDDPIFNFLVDRLRSMDWNGHDLLVRTPLKFNHPSMLELKIAISRPQMIGQRVQPQIF